MSDKLYFVRHAKAGDRRRWVGDDSARPLNEPGQQQAVRLADTFAQLPPARLLSSPYQRCIDTLQPTAERSGVPIEPTAALAEGADFEGVLELLASVPNGSVLCSHGDVIPATLSALERRGTVIRTTPDWRKAATWVLTREADGTVSEASAWPPPE